MNRPPLACTPSRRTTSSRSTSSRCLRGIDDMRACGLGQDQLDEQLWALVESKIPMRSRRTPGWKDDLRKDTASHFILRLAYCRTEELRLWFLEQEAYLLPAPPRLERLNEDGLAAFIRREQLVFDMVSEEEKAAKASVLQTSVRGPLLSTMMEFERTAFYKLQGALHRGARARGAAARASTRRPCSRRSARTRVACTSSTCSASSRDTTGLATSCR